MSKITSIELSEEEYWSYEDCFNVWYWRIHMSDGTTLKDEFYDMDPRYPQEHAYTNLSHCRRIALEKARTLTNESLWKLWRKTKIEKNIN